MTGHEIKAIRNRRKETQAEFGAHFGVDQATIHRWESNGISDRGVTAIAVEQVIKTLPPSDKESAA